MGNSQLATIATASAVKSTSPTDSPRIGVSRRRMSMSEVLTAAAYSKGGKSPSSTTSGDNAICGMPGMNEAATPTPSNPRGEGTPRGSQSRATTMTVAAMATRVRARSTVPIVSKVGHRPSTVRTRACA